jgi:hypothetical protein
VAKHAAVCRQVLLRTWSEVLARGEIQNLLGAKCFATSHYPPRGEIEDRHGETEGMVWRREPGQFLEPADERLWVVHPDAHVDAPEQALTRKPRPRRRQARDARRRTPSPRWHGRRVEANLMDLRSRRVRVGTQLSARAQRIHDERRLTREDEFAQVEMPIVLAAPADVLSRDDRLPRLHQRVDVAIAEVADPCEAARAARCRQEHRPALDRVHAVRSSRRRSPFRSVISHRDVDPVVVDRA